MRDPGPRCDARGRRVRADRRPLALLAAALLGPSLAGCGLGGVTPRAELERYASTGKILYVGSVYDLQRPGARAGDGEPAATAGPELLRRRQVQIPVSEVRSVFADALSRAGVFAGVVNPPAAFAGDTPDAMVAHAQQSSDYLLVGEVSQFHVKSVGLNGRAAVALPLDIVLAPFALGTYVTTGGTMGLFTGGVLDCWTAEADLSMSVSLIDVATGHVAHTVRLHERVRRPYDGTDAFGAFWDGSDDWIDLGRRLGEVALHNAAVDLAARLAGALGAAPDGGPASAPEELTAGNE